jgi:FkbM family methyltransferase
VEFAAASSGGRGWSKKNREVKAVRIFLDVGAHYGESLDVALDPRWGFEKICSFEPAHSCQRVLRGFRDERVRVVPAGLSRATGSATLFGAGLGGASVYADKVNLGGDIEQETVSLVRATDWVLANTSDGDEIYLKLNCEGSECDVLEDLLDSGAISRITSIYVDFDVRKIPSQAHRQTAVEERLRERRRHFVTRDVLSSPGGPRAVREWLTMVSDHTPSASGRLRYRLGLHRPRSIWLASVVVRLVLVAKAVLPRAMYVQAARCIRRLGVVVQATPAGPLPTGLKWNGRRSLRRGK